MFKLLNVFFLIEDEPVADEAADLVVKMSRKYLSKMENIFVQIAEYIYLNFSIYLFKLRMN